MEDRADSLLINGYLIRLFDLREDLSIAENQRIQPHHHTKHMADGFFILEIEAVFARPVGPRLLGYQLPYRSEERRVGKECRSRRAPSHLNTNTARRRWRT